MTPSDLPDFLHMRSIIYLMRFLSLFNQKLFSI